MVDRVLQEARDPPVVFGRRDQEAVCRSQGILQCEDLGWESAAILDWAAAHLRNVLAYLDVPTLGQPEVFIHVKEGVFVEPGKLGESTGKFLQGWMDKYVAWVKSHAA